MGLEKDSGSSRPPVLERSPNLQHTGRWLILISIGVGLFALTMDTSVETTLGRINNIGLLNEQQNILLVAAALFLGGVILFVLGRDRDCENESVQGSSHKTCPFCAETIQNAAVLCRYCGRDLPRQVAADSDLAQRKDGDAVGKEQTTDTSIADNSIAHVELDAQIEWAVRELRNDGYTIAVLGSEYERNEECVSMFQVNGVLVTAAQLTDLAKGRRSYEELQAIQRR